MINSNVRIVDAVLTGSLGLLGKTYIADKIVPPVFYNKDSVKVPEWGKEHMYVGDMRRSPGSNVSRQQSTLSNTAYTMEQYAREEPLPEEYVQIADTQLQLELSISKRLEDQFFKQKEINFATLFTNTANFGNDAPPAFVWSNVGSAVPITDIQTGIDDVANRLGFSPNTMVMDLASWNALKWTDQVQAWKNKNVNGTMKPSDFASIFSTDDETQLKIYIARGIYNDGTAVDGQGAILPIYPNFCSILYVEPKPAPMSMSWAYTLSLKGYPVVEKYVEYQTVSNVIRYRNYYTHAVVAPDAGYLITSTL